MLYAGLTIRVLDTRAFQMLASVANRALTNLSEPNTLDRCAEQETEQAAAEKPRSLKHHSTQNNRGAGRSDHAPRIPHF